MSARRLVPLAACALAATSLSPRDASAQSEALSWHAPRGECPTEETVRAWFLRELEIGGAQGASRVVISAWHGEPGWRAVIRRRRGASIATTEVTAESCEALAHTAVQEVVFDAAVLPEPSPREAVAPVGFELTPPPDYDAAPVVARAARPTSGPLRVARSAAPRASMPYLWIDVGLGVGASTMNGGSVLAEATSGNVNAICTGDVCESYSGLATSTFVHIGLRARVSERIAIGLQARVQLDAAPWSIAWSQTDDMGTLHAGHAPNDFANLLLGLRVYYSLSSRGWGAHRLEWSLFGGAGLGQIEPRVTTTRHGDVHAMSGFWNVNAGLRADYAVAGPLHVGAEVAAQVMFPTTLFDVDLSAIAGLHF